MATIAPYPARSDFNGQTISQREPDAFNFSRPNLQEVRMKKFHLGNIRSAFFLPNLLPTCQLFQAP